MVVLVVVVIAAAAAATDFFFGFLVVVIVIVVGVVAACLSIVFPLLLAFRLIASSRPSKISIFLNEPILGCHHAID
jgi:hypothetical protein